MTNSGERTRQKVMGKTRGYYDELRLMGKPVIVQGEPLRTPWPMTAAEGWMFFATSLLILMGGFWLAFVVGAEFIEPSLYRLLPPTLFVAALFVGAGVGGRLLRPKNMREREESARLHRIDSGS
ncbi:hypothetical protein JSO19_03905 [Leucobacter sp. UCMA 4100]|uniref:hypothetical protein n=1 Tax=Leucobacter sp. UCMA 4100 TaxID=2810534 RepID=UPI0022EB4D9A|nr:hypothetical protein [Leucobacter sp. UCMA 4100]MDA3146520.1 hypothetical protein [Leucobacter sp. UCMA 4100]